MVRTQVYLTAAERRKLAALAKATGKTQSKLIREAVDRLIDQPPETDRDTVLARAAGLWKQRKDLPDFQTLRAQWDRG